MNHASHSLDVFDRVCSLHLNGHFARFGQDQMGFNIFEPCEDLENANAINRSRGSGNANDQFPLVAQFTNSNVSWSPSFTASALFSRTGATISILSFG